MFTLNKVFVTTLITLLPFVSCGDTGIKELSITTDTRDANPAEYALLTPVNVTQYDVGHIYTYECTSGTYSSNVLAGSSNNINIWTSPHQMTLTLRCPNIGSGLLLSYVEVFIAVSTPNLNCFIHEGGVGLGYIGVTVNAWNTKYFAYSAKFYS